MGETTSHSLERLQRFAKAAGTRSLRRLRSRADYLIPRIRREISLRAAPLYRPLLRKTLFIAVTGSCGKSTTKELIGGIFGIHMKGRITPLNLNQPMHVARTILRTRPWHHFSVHEIGIGPRGEREISTSARLVQPQVGIVTNVGEDHISALGSKQEIAAEKAKLVEALPPHGVAILNADDELVLAMRSRCKCRVITYGCSEQAMVRAMDVRSEWPDRLSFTVTHDGRSESVETQLLGTHLVSCALAAIATALAAGMSLNAAARGLQTVSPFESRMSVHPRADGIVFVRDDAKAPVWTLPAILEFLAKARATRKILVVGTLSDYSHHRPTLVGLCKQASAIVDEVIFIGSHAWQVLRTQGRSGRASVRAFNSFESAHDYVDALLRPGDLVLLKGGWKDGLERLMRPRRTLSPDPGMRVSGAAEESTEGDSASSAVPAVVVVGVGNPGNEYYGTRHNIGQAVVDRVAEHLKTPWQQSDGAWVARTERRGVTVYLVKPVTMINETGTALRQLFDAERLFPHNSILVHDEVELPVGSIRGRVEGGPGGHRGVGSVLSAFDDHRFRRVKIGIGRPPSGVAMDKHVLSQFRPDEQEALERAEKLALDQILLFINELIAVAMAKRHPAFSMDESTRASLATLGASEPSPRPIDS
jgi:aminoacyl-tRNA hydrolase